jgi:hypothetical protein
MGMRLLGLDPAATLPGPAREITVEPIEVPRREPERLPDPEPEPVKEPEPQREPEKVPA